MSANPVANQPSADAKGKAAAYQPSWQDVETTTASAPSAATAINSSPLAVNGVGPSGGPSSSPTPGVAANNEDSKPVIVERNTE